MKKITDLLSVFVFVIPCALTVFMPRLISQLVSNALKLCVFGIVPSLFPFLVLSQLLARSGAGERAGYLFAPVLSPLLGIKKSLCGIFLTGLISGFPNGAVSAGIAYSDGKCSRYEAEKVLALSDNCSFSFVCIVAGLGALGSIKNGIILFAAQVISTLITAQILRLYSAGKDCHSMPAKSKEKCVRGNSSTITMSITESSLNMLYICGFITVFYVLSGVICNFLPKYYPAQFFVRAALEVSGAVSFSGISSFPLNCVLCSFCIGFSGLSVIFQVSDVCSRCGLSPKLFIISRLYGALLLPLATVILLLILPRQAIGVFNSNSVAASGISVNIFYVLLSVIVMVIPLFVQLLALIKSTIVRKFSKK